MPSFRPILLSLSLALFAAPVAHAQEAQRDLGLVFFDEWPRDLPTPDDDGIPVRWAVPKSPAALGGFKPGDILLNVDLYTVTREGLQQRWIEKSTGAAGCIPMAIIRTELKPKGWKNVTLCVPVAPWTMPDDATQQADALVPLAIVSGQVEGPGTYALNHLPLPQALLAARPETEVPVLACLVPRGPAPLPPADCGTPDDPKWKTLPKNRSYLVSVTKKPTEEAIPPAPIEPAKPPAIPAAATAPDGGP